MKGTDIRVNGRWAHLCWAAASIGADITLVLSSEGDAVGAEGVFQRFRTSEALRRGNPPFVQVTVQPTT